MWDLGFGKSAVVAAEGPGTVRCSADDSMVTAFPAFVGKGPRALPLVPVPFSRWRGHSCPRFSSTSTPRHDRPARGRGATHMAKVPAAHLLANIPGWSKLDAPSAAP